MRARHFRPLTGLSLVASAICDARRAHCADGRRPVARTQGGLNGAPIPDEKSCRLEGSRKKTANKPGLGRYGNLPGPGPGRPKGVPNKFSGQLKEALLSAFNGAHPDGLASWVLQEAKANPTAGLALLGRLIPVSTEGTLDATLTVRHVDETAD